MTWWLKPYEGEFVCLQFDFTNEKKLLNNKLGWEFMYGFLIFNAILQKLIAINLCELQPRLREYALTRLSGDTKPMLPISRLWLMEYMIFNYVDVMKQIPKNFNL